MKGEEGGCGGEGDAAGEAVLGGMGNVSGASPRERRTGPRSQSQYMLARGTFMLPLECTLLYLGKALEAEAETDTTGRLGLVLGPVARIAEGESLRPDGRWSSRRCGVCSGGLGLRGVQVGVLQ